MSRVLECVALVLFAFRRSEVDSYVGEAEEGDMNRRLPVPEPMGCPRTWPERRE